MSEKRKPTYDLESFQAWSLGPMFQVTGTALKTAAGLGLTSDDIIDTIQNMRRSQFYKSMTSYSNHTVWQDVYYVPSDIGELYVKFQAEVVTEFVLLSFKESTDD